MERQLVGKLQLKKVFCFLTSRTAAGVTSPTVMTKGDNLFQGRKGQAVR
jgi:hypothetical protein